MEQTVSKSLADSPLWRIVALLLAALFAWLLWSNYADDFKAVMDGSETAVTMPLVSKAPSVAPANPVLDQCLTQRIGDVDRMKEEGILSDAQYSSFRARAEELCRAQNPGS